MTILGLHHITLVTSDARRNVAFYTRVLGLRLVKKTVNFDDPGAYHLYFGNESGSAGSAITFFEWRDVPRGRPGIGGTHHFALTVADETGLLKWKRRLTDLGLAVIGPRDRSYFKSIYFDDPDGVHIEIATAGPGFAVDEPADQLGQAALEPPAETGDRARELAAATWPELVPEVTPDMALSRGMHHISAISSNLERTNAFFGDLLGMRIVKRTKNYDAADSRHWYWSAAADGAPGSLITYFERDPRKQPRAQMGAGQTHHFALAVENDAAQLAWREKLVRAGLNVSPVMDRTYFKSIYTNDPDGHIVELATVPPGFAVDEPLATLGQTLKLPPWLEPHRAEIQAALTPL